MISVGMNTDLKIKEERVWSNWFKGMFGDEVYLINNISTIEDGATYQKPELIDYSESFPNPGHIPGCCHGLTLGLNHLKKIEYEGPVILTVCDVIANEEFQEIINFSEYDAQIYTHDWGGGYTATDWIFLTPEIWKSFKFPTNIGRVTETGVPVMEDYMGRRFLAPDYYPVLEQWNTVFIQEMGWKNNYTLGHESPAWKGGKDNISNVGTRLKINNVSFNVVQSAGEARPTKTHLTNKYMEFDRPYEN